jgi:elongator complex protein 3
MSITLAKKEERAITELLSVEISTRDELDTIKRRIAKKYQLPITTNSAIMKVLSVTGAAKDSSWWKILKKRAVRTLSGIAPVAVLTKPWPCPGKCAYCPTEKNVPQSYLSNEPAVMRAIREHYDPYAQVQSRLSALEANGHEPTKIELIVIGGTWSVLPENYKYWYITNCFAAANNFGKNQNAKISARGGSQPGADQPLAGATNSGGKNQNDNVKCKIDKLRQRLLKEQKKNETAKYKIIGLTLETRPDHIDEKELVEMRELGCTRVELGVQAIDDKILNLNKRGHGVDKIAEATKLLKDAGFKVTYHIMPGLPGATPAMDLKMFKQLFADERFKPDQIKFYPTVVTRGSLLYRWWQDGKYKPYTQKALEKLITDCKSVVPPYVRIIRLIRDIPGESIVAGNLITNLRQVLARRGVRCDCIRCREVKDGKISNFKIQIIGYQASDGMEYFIEAVSKDNKTLYGFCRLRLPGSRCPTSKFSMSDIGVKNLFDNTALIRELHVYGELVSVGGRKIIQHIGLGKKLMAVAEKIANQQGFKKIAVISGVGARGYYRKLGYRLTGTYMIKNG